MGRDCWSSRAVSSRFQSEQEVTEKYLAGSNFNLSKFYQTHVSVCPQSPIVLFMKGWSIKILYRRSGTSSLFFLNMNSHGNQIKINIGFGCVLADIAHRQSITVSGDENS